MNPLTPPNCESNQSRISSQSMMILSREKLQLQKIISANKKMLSLLNTELQQSRQSQTQLKQQNEILCQKLVEFGYKEQKTNLIKEGLQRDFNKIKIKIRQEQLRRINQQETIKRVMLENMQIKQQLFNKQTELQGVKHQIEIMSEKLQFFKSQSQQYENQLREIRMTQLSNQLREIQGEGSHLGVNSYNFKLNHSAKNRKKCRKYGLKKIDKSHNYTDIVNQADYLSNSNNNQTENLVINHSFSHKNKQNNCKVIFEEQTNEIILSSNKKYVKPSLSTRKGKHQKQMQRRKE